MKKLTLEIENLSVESFDTARPPAETEGTVHGFATQGNRYTCDPAVGTCFGYTCYESCGDTCADTCANTCNPVVGTCMGYTCIDACY